MTDQPRLTLKTGMPQVCEAVTLAAGVLAQIKRAKVLDDRDRALCERAQRELELAEKTLYGYGTEAK